MKPMVDKLKQNWKSGITVALVSIPLSVSLSVASGTSPVIGILTAIWAGLVMSLIGGSNFNIVGPTGALSGILAAYAFTNGANSLAMLAIITGVFILIAYLLKLERYLVFVPASTIHGFTLGVAAIIALNQMNNALGLSGLEVHEKFFDNLVESLTHLNELSIATFVLFAISLILLFVFMKLSPKFPGVIILTPIGILIGYLCTEGILNFDITTLGSKYPDLKAILFVMPQIQFSTAMITTGLAVAIVAIIETMISAKVADGMTKTKHNSRKEMFALGVSNIVSGGMGGIPATAALARTSLNIKTGATDKISATISSVVIVVVAMLFLTYFKYIPLAMIAAILVFVAVRMVELEHFGVMWKHERKSFFIAIFVALVCIYEDPIIGILVGTVVALLMFMEKLSHGQFELSYNDQTGTVKNIWGDERKVEIDNCETLVYSIKGQLVYINAQSHVSRFENNVNGYKNVILRLREVSFIDLDGVDALDQIIEIIEGHGRNVYLTGVSSAVENMLADSENYARLKKEGYVYTKTSEALDFIRSDQSPR